MHPDLVIMTKLFHCDGRRDLPCDLSALLMAGIATTLAKCIHKFTGSATVKKIMWVKLPVRRRKLYTNGILCAN